MAIINGDTLNNTFNDTVGSSDIYNLFGGNDTVYAGGGTDTLNGGNDNDLLYGGNASDTIYGDAGNDQLFGGADASADTLYGGTEDDTLEGGSGNDRLFGDAGNDYLYAGNFVGPDSDSLDGGGGQDTVDFSQGDEAVTLTLVAGAATFNPPTGNQDTDSLAGIEHIVGTNFADNITGDTVANMLSGGTGADSLFGGIGTDTLYGGDDADSLRGGADSDTLYGGAGVDNIGGQAGNDVLIGGAGADVLDGGTETDTASYVGSAAVNVTINATSGNTGGDAAGDQLSNIENLTGSSNGDTLVGDGGNNVIDGGAGADTINGAAGNDTVLGGVGGDTIDGGIGNDSLSGEGDADSILGGAGNDTIYGGAGADTLSGDAGNDSIFGDGEADTIYGGMGNDTIDGGSGDDVITAGPTVAGSGTPVALDFNWSAIPGGDGTDISNITQNTGGVNVNVVLTTPGATFQTFEVETGLNVYVAGGEPFAPGSSGWLARGGAGAPTVVDINFAGVPGAGMNDEVENVQFRISDLDEDTFRDRVVIRAWDADGNPITVVLTETSADLITSTVGGATVQVINGAGNTTPDQEQGSVLVTIAGPVARIEISYDNLETTTQYIYVSDIHFDAILAVDNDSVTGGVGNDTIFGNIGQDTLLGGADNDVLYGGADNDSLSGETGNDTLYGDAGNDTLLGGADNDVLYGGTENDSVSGEAGNDTVFGDAGNDTLLGGADNDVLYGGADNDSLNGGTGNDTLFGDAGTDTMSGAAGNDIFVIANNAEVSSTGNDVILGGGGAAEGGTGAGQDTVTDYDVIDLSAFANEQVDVVYSNTDPENLVGTISIYQPGMPHIPANLIGVIDFSEIEKVIECFTPGTMIRTESGDVAVELLQAGDMVMTRDNGLQPLRWICARTLSVTELQANPDLQPVRIAKGALAQGPSRTMLVSPQHRVLIEGARAELLFGEAEVLVPAKHLVGQIDATRALPSEGVTYIHILFDSHEIVMSDGIWSESFQPAQRTLSAMDAEVRAEVLALFPALETDADAYVGARLSLKAHEARVLLAK